MTIMVKEEDGVIRFKVSDQGIGMTPEQVQRVFDPAFSKKGPRVKATMGLFTSYQIVEQHKGDIRIESELGKGTTVTVILPAV